MLKAVYKRAFGGTFDFLSEPFERLPRMGKLYKTNEAIRLYRRAIKMAKRIYWNDESGLPWAQQIIYSARMEIEYSKTEKDPYIIGQLLLNGNKAVEDLGHKITEMEFKMAKQFSNATLSNLKDKKMNEYEIPKYAKIQTQYKKETEKKKSKLIIP